jgi:hypothetical protein
MARKTKDEQFDDMTASLGRFASENSYYRREARKFYERARALENAIRHHAEGRCTCKTPQACLLVLGRKVPTQPRQRYGKAKVAAKKGSK